MYDACIADVYFYKCNYNLRRNIRFENDSNANGTRFSEGFMQSG